ncbi:MAG: hypothetical protein IKU94_00690 [Bacteroidaceae bacterium]|nr:hypothetical protein [Bacteroidaceae bacterium]MBR4930446.1 hypothetical protein [Bacteroidaceae bacterium]
MAKTIKLNNVDFTEMFTKYGYSVSYTSVQGNQGGIMKDGSYMEDELAVKAIVTIPCLPLNEEQLAAVLTAVYSGPYVSLYYYDPRSGGYRDIIARRNKVDQKYKGTGSDGREYWVGTVLTLQEK